MNDKKPHSHPDYKIEKAIIFLVNEFSQSGRNPKPVIFHSIRVGMRLYKESKKPEVVMAGFLHDLLEDTKVTEEKIEENFGKKVLALVKANSEDRKIKNERERNEEMLCRCANAGGEAMMIKAADILDNSDFYCLAGNKKRRILLEKLAFAIDQFRPQLKGEPIFKELEEKYQKLERRFLN